MTNPNDPVFATDTVDFELHAQALKEPENVGRGPLGLSKREYFAAMAMQGLLTSDKVRNVLNEHNTRAVPNLLAELSVEMADDLIAELNK
jgi:hypothetical protein